MGLAAVDRNADIGSRDISFADLYLSLADHGVGASGRAWCDGTDRQSSHTTLVRGPGLFQLQPVFLPGAEFTVQPLNQEPSLHAMFATRLPSAIASFFSSSSINGCFLPWAQ